MDPPPAFRFPTRDAGPLLPLSAERVNGARNISNISTNSTASRGSKNTETESQDGTLSAQSSPTRRAKANLFADYHPTTATPTNKMMGFGGLPQSPSLPEINALRAHVRTNSDVQGLVKRFEHLDVRDKDAESVEYRKRHEAELRRAQIAREEAESDAKRLREEVRRLKKEGEESRERERMVAKRLEVVMVCAIGRRYRYALTRLQEDQGAGNDSHASQAAIYEKELRKARKEAFKSSSAVLKLQEELKSTRNTLRVTQSGFDLEMQKVQRKEQERFEMEYQIVPVQEELIKLQQRLQVVEEEKEALKTHLKEEEVARVAAEGMIALPASQDQDDDLLNSPTKRSPSKRAPSPLSDDKENIQAVTKKSSESRRMAEELEREKAKRAQAEDLVDFMRMECMFRCCGCKTASRLGHEFAVSLDAELAAGIMKIREGMENVLAPVVGLSETDEMDFAPDGAVQGEHATAMEVVETSPEAMVEDCVPVDAVHCHEEMDRSATFTAESPIPARSPDDQLHEEEEVALKAESPILTGADKTAATVTLPLEPLPPSTPLNEHDQQSTPFRHPHSIRTVTTTTTVPMHFTPITHKLPPVFDPEDAENLPPTEGPITPSFDRAAALAAIEWRRGRAKSIANGHVTPRKQMLEGVKERRDISAPALGQKGGVGGAASVGRSAKRQLERAW